LSFFETGKVIKNSINRAQLGFICGYHYGKVTTRRKRYICRGQNPEKSE
jgi:hypothetical protein